MNFYIISNIQSIYTLQISCSSTKNKLYLLQYITILKLMIYYIQNPLLILIILNFLFNNLIFQMIRLWSISDLSISYINDK